MTEHKTLQIVFEDKSAEYKQGFKDCFLETIRTMEEKPDQKAIYFIPAFKFAVHLMDKYDNIKFETEEADEERD